MNSHLRIVSFNCHGIKNALGELNGQCNSHDIVCIQEHWLMPHDLSVLNSVSDEFHALGSSTVDVEREILRGRPYGGTTILYRKSIGCAIEPVTL